MDTSTLENCTGITTEHSTIIVRPINTVKRLTLVLSSIAIVANLLSLLAIYNIKKKLNANLRLIVSLCAADLLVALCFLILSSDNRLVRQGSSSYGITCLVIVLRSVRNGIHIVTLLNLLGLALDHYYAIVRTLHYRAVMSTQRVTWMISAMWALSFLLSFSDFYIPSALFSHCKTNMSLCERAECTVYNSEHLVFIITLITFLVLLYFYISIFVTLRKNNSLLLGHRQVMQKKKQGTITTILILGTFVVFWLPYCLFEMTVTFMTITDLDRDKFFNLVKVYVKINFYLYDILLLNSVCDPLIYAWRMRDVQRGYRCIIRSITCSKYYMRQRTFAHYRKTSMDSVTQFNLTMTQRKKRKTPLYYQGSHLSEESTTAMNCSVLYTPMTTKRKTLPNSSNPTQVNNVDNVGLIPEILEDEIQSKAQLMSEDWIGKKAHGCEYFHGQDEAPNYYDLPDASQQLFKYLLKSNRNLSLPNSGEMIYPNSKCLSDSSSDPNLGLAPLLSDQSSTTIHSLPELQDSTEEGPNDASHKEKKLLNSSQDENFQKPLRRNSTHELAMYSYTTSSSMPNVVLVNQTAPNSSRTHHRTSTPCFKQNKMGKTSFVEEPVPHTKLCKVHHCNGYCLSKNETPIDISTMHQDNTTSIVCCCENTSDNVIHIENDVSDSSSISLTSLQCDDIFFGKENTRKNHFGTTSNCLLLNSVPRIQNDTNCKVQASSNHLELKYGNKNNMRHDSHQHEKVKSNSTGSVNKYKQKWHTSKEKVLSHILSKRPSKDSTLT